jgi:hypothetical protein
VKAFRASLNLELDFLPFGERFESIHCDRGEVHEDVLTSLLFYEAVPLGFIEPLYFPSGQCKLPPTRCINPALLVLGTSYDGRRRYRNTVIFCQEIHARVCSFPLRFRLDLCVFQVVGSFYLLCVCLLRPTERR